MAGKKPKTPPPPRRVQAPQKRTDPKSPRSPADTHRALLYGAAGAGIVALVAVVAFIALAGGHSKLNDSRVASLMGAAGCTFRTNIKIKVPGGKMGSKWRLTRQQVLDIRKAAEADTVTWGVEGGAAQGVLWVFGGGNPFSAANASKAAFSVMENRAGAMGATIGGR